MPCILSALSSFAAPTVAGFSRKRNDSTYLAGSARRRVVSEMKADAMFSRSGDRSFVWYSHVTSLYWWLLTLAKIIHVLVASSEIHFSLQHTGYINFLTLNDHNFPETYECTFKLRKENMHFQTVWKNKKKCFNIIYITLTWEQNIFLKLCKIINSAYFQWYQNLKKKVIFTDKMDWNT